MFWKALVAVDPGTKGLMLGGVKKHESSWFDTLKNAQDWAYTINRTNLEARPDLKLYTSYVSVKNPPKSQRVGRINPSPYPSYPAFAGRRRRNPARATAASSAGDTVAAHELYLFALSDRNLWRQRIDPVILNLRKKVKKGIYRPDLALKLWKYVADDAAKRYTHGGYGSSPGYGIFTVPIRVQAARELQQHYESEVMQTNPVMESGPLLEKRNVKIRFTAQEVRMFRRIYPASGLSDRSYWFEFDPRGDLVDTDVPNEQDGPGASALAEDAKRYAFDDEQPEWMK